MGGEQAVENIPFFARIDVCMYIYLFHAPNQTKTDNDFKFGTQTPLDYI